MERNILHIKDFSFSYPGQEKNALDNINIDLKEGSFNVLCGRSGCGKSTLLRHLKPTLSPVGIRSGVIMYDGEELGKLDIRRQSSELGYVLQDPDNQIVTDKVWHELAFGLESLGYDSEIIRLRVAEMASYFGINKWFYKNVNELSGGQKQLLNLAAIMAMHPRVLILDEPTSQLDPIAAADFLETVHKINRDIGTTIILTEHRLEEVIPVADKVIVMDAGQIISVGRPYEIGNRLRELEHGMFLAMPAPMRIYSGVVEQYEDPGQERNKIEGNGKCPLTVREGRVWLNELVTKNNADSCTSDNEKSIFKKIRQKRNEKHMEKAVELEDIWFRYEKNEPDVVRGLSFSVKKGIIYAIAGGNGTGKSTAISLISGARKVYRGNIRIEGKNINKYNDKQLYRGLLGVLPQDPQSIFVKRTVYEDMLEMLDDMEYNSDMSKSEAISGMAKMLQLEELLDRHPYDLSGGEQQRLAMAKILLLRPRILLLDEATKGLDAEFKQVLGSILKKLSEHGITIIMVSHDVEFIAEYADEVGLFFEGNIVSSAPVKQFFSGNSFYTTSANRMAREYFPDAVTADQVVQQVIKYGRGLREDCLDV